MRAFQFTLCTLLCLLLPAMAWAGFTETLPQGTFLFDIGYVHSVVENRWDDDGELVPLIDPIERYEPGAGKQGILVPQVRAELAMIAPQVYYGILDNLLFGFGVPIMLYSDVDPRFEWERGDYQWNLGRSYSEDDFWQWAGSMGQPEPQPWRGNEGTLGDVLLGLRFRYSDYWSWFDKHDMALAMMLIGALPTGTPPDPELVITAGTTSWDLHANGEFGIHLSYDKFFKKSLDNRLTLGFEVFYEFFFPREYESSTGEENPLMLTYRPYVGKRYTIDGGDFSGFSVQTDIVPWRGRARQTWLTRSNPDMAANLPPLLTLTLRYTFTHLQQTDWQSNSEIWDWEREKLWKPGYKNILFGQVAFSLLRLGIPLQPYVAYRNLTWIPGKNARAPNVLLAGTKAILKFW